MPHDLSKHLIHLGLGATAVPQPEFTGDMAWYEAYAARHAADGAEGRLVAMHTSEAPWGHWEMHPEGDEVVVCLDGEMTLIQEVEGREERVVLGPGEYAINPARVWHSADVDAPARALFITAGKGTEHRPR